MTVEKKMTEIEQFVIDWQNDQKEKQTFWQNYYGEIARRAWKDTRIGPDYSKLSPRVRKNWNEIAQAVITEYEKQQALVNTDARLHRIFPIGAWKEGILPK